jgi:hypothetical protein
MLAPIVHWLFEHGVCHVGAQDLALAQPIERIVGGARVATHLNVECVADAFPASLNVDLYLLQRHELGKELERTIAALRTILFDGSRGAVPMFRRDPGSTPKLPGTQRYGLRLVMYCCEAVNSGSPPVFV